MIFTSILCSCTDEVARFVEPSQSASKMQDRTSMYTRSFSTEGIVALEENDSFKTLKEKFIENKAMKPHALPSECKDEFLAENLYAIRDLPLTISAHAVASDCNSTNHNFNCSGANSEVVLGDKYNDYDAYFYIKVLPASSGVPYMLYSKASDTPLRIGYYTKDPDTKILMASKDNTGSTFGAGWNLVPSNTSGYFYIESNDYLAQDDPNNWMSIFYYVLEASSNNKIRFAKRVNDKAQQEFSLFPVNTFKVTDVTFDLDNGTITNAADLVVKKSIVNEEDYEQSMAISIDTIGKENSRFVEHPGYIRFTKKILPTIAVRRPHAVANKVVILENDSSFVPYLTMPLDLQKHISYPISLEMKASSLLQLTVRFKRFNLSVPFVMSAKYNDRIVKVRGTWYSTEIANPNRNAPVLETRFYDLETGKELNYHLLYNKSRKIHVVK